MKEAKFVREILVRNMDTKEDVSISIYKHPNGGLFGIDTEYLSQNFDDDVFPIVPDPFCKEFNPTKIMLYDEYFFY